MLIAPIRISIFHIDKEEGLMLRKCLKQIAIDVSLHLNETPQMPGEANCRSRIAMQNLPVNIILKQDQCLIFVNERLWENWDKHAAK